MDKAKKGTNNIVNNPKSCVLCGLNPPKEGDVTCHRCNGEAPKDTETIEDGINHCQCCGEKSSWLWLGMCKSCAEAMSDKPVEKKKKEEEMNSKPKEDAEVAKVLLTVAAALEADRISKAARIELAANLKEAASRTLRFGDCVRTAYADLRKHLSKPAKPVVTKQIATQPVVTQPQGTVTCPKCKGTGQFTFASRVDGLQKTGACFDCKGSGHIPQARLSKLNERRGKAAKVRNGGTTEENVIAGINEMTPEVAAAILAKFTAAINK